MIKIVAKCTVQENNIEEFITISSKLSTETRKEEGCISYGLFQDVKNNKILTFIEEWESQESLSNHMNSLHMKEIMPKLVQLQENAMEVNVYKVVI